MGADLGEAEEGKGEFPFLSLSSLLSPPGATTPYAVLRLREWWPGTKIPPLLPFLFSCAFKGSFPPLETPQLPFSHKSKPPPPRFLSLSLLHIHAWVGSVSLRYLVVMAKRSGPAEYFSAAMDMLIALRCMRF